MKLILHNSDGNVIKEMDYGKLSNYEYFMESPEALARLLSKKAIRPCGSELQCEKCPYLKDRCSKDDFPTDYEVWMAWLKQDADE